MQARRGAGEGGRGPGRRVEGGDGERGHRGLGTSTVGVPLVLLILRSVLLEISTGLDHEGTL